MKLAPRMIQSMEVLQMPLAELEARIEQELGSNPTLELDEVRGDAEALQAELTQSQRDDLEAERQLETDAGAADDFERLSNLSEQYGESWDANTSEGGEAFSRRMTRASAGERDGKLDAMANTASRTASLYEQLMDQWRLMDLDDSTREVGAYLIGLIDETGYLRVPLNELVEQAPESWTAEQITDAIDRLQTDLDPAGMGARDLRECLLLQIAALELAEGINDVTERQRVLVDLYLPEIEKNRLPKIARATGWSIDEIKETVASLRRYPPHPGRLLATEETRHITPDAVIDYDERQDAYVATLTDSGIPALVISRDYQDMAKDKTVDKRTRDFIGQQLRSADWLLDAIQQRQNTLLRVIGVVIQAQREFFDVGPQALRPLPMTQVADQLGVHVATVSRAVSEKYLQTPRGILPLRMFFSGGTESADGEAMSWTAVQAKLKEIIDDEDKTKPLSDDALVEKLKAEGLEIARRTVAKYRSQLNIPTARQRREY